jgi:hypothetical protein
MGRSTDGGLKPLDFLRAVAATMPGRPSPTRTSSMAQFAVKVAAEFRHATLTHSVADVVATKIGEEMPAWSKLADAIRGSLPEDTAVYAIRRGWEPEPVPVDPEAMDRDWWNERVAGWTAAPAWVELSNLQGAMIALTGRHPSQQGRCHPRPALVARVADRIAELEAQGHKAVDLRPVAGRGPGLRYVAHNEAHGPTVTTRPDAPAHEPTPPKYLTGEARKQALAKVGVTLIERAAE